MRELSNIDFDNEGNPAFIFCELRGQCEVSGKISGGTDRITLKQIG